MRYSRKYREYREYMLRKYQFLNKLTFPRAASFTRKTRQMGLIWMPIKNRDKRVSRLAIVSKIFWEEIIDSAIQCPNCVSVFRWEKQVET